MTTGRGRVSVVMPCHDAGSLMGESIRSILAQRSGVEELEVIVVDDRSSDPETLRELRRWEEDSRVRVVASRHDPGPAGARNTGLSEATGEWVAFLDADDLWLPGSLQARWEVVEREPDASFVSADFGYLMEDGSQDREGFYRTRPIPREVLATAFREDRVLRLETPVAHFLRAVLVWTGVVLVRRSLLLEAGGFEESLMRAEDDHLWIRLARRADLFFIPRVVALYRRHRESLTHREEPPSKWGIMAYRKLLRDPGFAPYRPLIRRRLSKFAVANAYYHRARGERAKAVREAAGAVRWRPGDLRAWEVLMGALVGRP